MFRGTAVQVGTYLLVVCLLSITFLVFVNASISFVITDLLKSRKHVGDDVGTLGFVDELVAIVACPLWGAVSDKIGTRTVVVMSYLIIGTSLFCFVNASNVFPGLLLVRMLFSIGAAGATTMVTAVLPSLTMAPRVGSLRDLSETAHDAARVETITNDDLDAQPDQRLKEAGAGSFRIAGLVGMAAGSGALLAVFGFLRLPLYFQAHHLTAAMALKDTFYAVGLVACTAALVSFFGLRNIASSKTDSAKTRGLISVLTMPYGAIKAAFHERAIGLAYLGGFVARASSVGISLFIPLWVNSFYNQSGRCQIGEPENAKDQCRDAYKLSSIITGVSQLSALICAPLFGFVSERLRRRQAPILLASAAGITAYSILALVDDPRIREGTIGALIFPVAVLVGFSQVGAIVCSLGLLSHAIAQNGSLHQMSARRTHSGQASGNALPNDDNDRSSSTTPLLSDSRASSCQQNSSTTIVIETAQGDENLENIKGSIAGMYSLAGGFGILLLTKLGGLLFDSSTPAAPFWLLASFNGVLFLGAGMGMLASVVSRLTQKRT